MGEYYNWVNVDKKEYICPDDFDYGNKRWETLYRGNSFLRALRTLLSSEWKGDHILFLGDEVSVPFNTGNPTLKKLYSHTVLCGYSGNPWDTVVETYRNISSLFKPAEAAVREGIGFYLESLRQEIERQLDSEYRLDPENPFAGFFLRTGKDFRYTINHTKKVYYSFERTRFLYPDGEEDDHADPLPLLMIYGSGTNFGPWLGDIIGVADQVPEGYSLRKEIYLDW